MDRNHEMIFVDNFSFMTKDHPMPPTPSTAEIAPSRRERRKADTRRRLLAAARKLFVEKGFDATRPQDIAQAADVAAGTFYVHFAHKRDAFLAFTEEVSDELAARFAEHVRGADAFGTRLDRALQALCDYSEANPGVLAAVFADAAVCAAELPPGKSLRDRLGASLASTLRLAMASGEVHADVDPDLIAHGTVGFIHSALVHAGARGLDRRTVLGDLERFLVRALVATESPGA
jgi:AcrR family transcriptional regulator